MTLQELPREMSRSGISYFKSVPAILSAPPIVLIHGVGLRAESWQEQISHYKNTHRLYVIDLPGHGHSVPLSPAEPEVEDYAQNILDFLKDVVGERCVIMGHSLGALIVTRLMARAPEMFIAIIAISTIYERSSQVHKAVIERADYIKNNPDQDLAIGPVSRWFDDIENPHAQLCAAMITSNSPIAYARAYKAFAQTKGVETIIIKTGQVPILFLTGADDYNSTAEMSEKLANLSKLAEFAIIVEARHMVQLSHAKDTHRAIDRFLEKVQTS